MNAITRNPDPATIARLETASEWLVRIHSDALTEAETAEWIQWCESDPENLAAFEEMEAVWGGLNQIAAAKSGQTTLVDASTRPAAKRKSRLLPRLIDWFGRGLPQTAFASGIVVLTVLGLALWNMRSMPTMPTIATGLETPIGKNEDARLPDGSVLALGAKSSVSLDFQPGERILRMKDGQAFFSVAADKERPFIVDTGPILVKAIGTAFDIRKNDDRIVVSVSEGTVEILPGTHDARGRQEAGQTRLQVAAGYQLTWTNQANEIKLAQIDPASATAWRRGRLEYFGEPLGIVVANVNRYSPRPIVIADEGIAQLQFTGTVFVHSIEDWTSALKDVFPVEIDSLPDGSLTIKRRASL